MVKKYELVLILDPQVGDTQLESASEKYKTQLEAAGGEIANVDTWGLRKLAYTSMALRQRQQGFYLLFQFEAEAEILAPLETALKLDEAVLRHMVIAVDGDFLRVPTLAPENVYIYNPPERPRDRRGGPRRDRDDRPPRRDESNGDDGDSSSNDDAEPATAGASSDSGDGDSAES